MASTMILTTSMQTPAMAATQRLSAQDWEALRPAISQQYIQQQQTARQICEQMNMRGLQVTEKMLKDRLSKWNLKKNNRSERSYAGDGEK